MPHSLTRADLTPSRLFNLGISLREHHQKTRPGKTYLLFDQDEWIKPIIKNNREWLGELPEHLRLFEMADELFAVLYGSILQGCGELKSVNARHDSS